MKLKTLATPISGYSYDQSTSHSLNAFTKMWTKYKGKSPIMHICIHMYTHMNVHMVQERGTASAIPIPRYLWGSIMKAEPGNMF